MTTREIGCRVAEQLLTSFQNQARAGQIKGFTGIDQPYEAPLNPELEVRTDQETVKESVHRVISLLRERVRVNAESS